MALLTAADLKTAGIPYLSGTGQDTEIGRIIAAVDDEIAAWLGFPPATVGAVSTIEDTTYTLYLDGPDDDETDVLRLGMWPVVSITSVHEDADRAYAAATLVDSDDYELDGAKGILIAKPLGSLGGWARGYRVQKVTAVIGFETVPAWAKEAAIVECQRRYKRGKGGSVETISGATGGNVQPRVEGGLLPEVRRMLWPHRLPGAVL